jgi:hypothetical protein
MNFLVFFLTILFSALISLVIGKLILAFFFGEKTSDQIEIGFSMALGLFLVFVIVGIAAYINHTLLKWSMPLVFMSTLAGLIKFPRVLNRSFFAFNLKLTLFVSAFLFIASSLLSSANFETRSHTSPDAYGYATLTGYLADNGSISKLEAELIKSIPKIDEESGVRIPWPLADARARYASDLGINSGRVGVSSFIASILIWVSPLKNYWWAIWLGLGIFFSILAALVTIGSARFLIKSKGVQQKISSLEGAIVFFVSSVPASTILIAEGASIQVLVPSMILVAILLPLSLLKLTENHGISKIRIAFVAGIPPWAMLLVYPHLLPVLFGLTACVYFLAPLIERKNFDTLVIGISMFSPLVFFAFNTDLGRRIYLGTFIGLGGSGGGAIQSLSFAPFSQLFGLSYKQLRLEPTTISGGITSLSAYYVEFFLLALLILLSVKVIKSNLTSIQLRILGFSVLLLNIPMLYRAIQDYEINTYYFFRQLSLIGLLSMPILLAAFISLHRRYNLNSLVVVFIICAASCLSLSNIFWDYGSKTTKSYLQPKCPESRVLQESILVNETPDMRVTGLALCGPIYYITDNWEPNFKVSEKVWVVRSVDSITFLNQIGTLLIEKKLKTPCDVLCLSQYSGFHSNHMTGQG